MQRISKGRQFLATPSPDEFGGNLNGTNIFVQIPVPISKWGLRQINVVFMGNAELGLFYGMLDLFCMGHATAKSDSYSPATHRVRDWSKSEAAILLARKYFHFTPLYVVCWINVLDKVD